MKYLLLLSLMLCASCLSFFDLPTNIDEDVAEHFACKILILTTQGWLKWDIDLRRGIHVAYFKGEAIYIDAFSMDIHVGSSDIISNIHIVNTCQKKLYKYLDDKYIKIHDEKAKIIQKDFFDRMLK